MLIEQLIALAEKTLEHRHSPWRLEDCSDWREASDKKYVAMGCDFIVEPPTHPLDDGEDRMAYLAACDPAIVLPFLRELQQLRASQGKRDD